MTSVNIQLVEEIFKNEGSEAVVKYLTTHESMSTDQAHDFMKKNFPTAQSELEEKYPLVFAHYCLLDKQEWIGIDGSLCPLCGTNGDVNDNVEDKQAKSSIWTHIKEKASEIKEEVMG